MAEFHGNIIAIGTHFVGLAIVRQVVEYKQTKRSTNMAETQDPLSGKAAKADASENVDSQGSSKTGRIDDETAAYYAAAQAKDAVNQAIDQREKAKATAEVDPAAEHLFHKRSEAAAREDAERIAGAAAEDYQHMKSWERGDEIVDKAIKKARDEQGMQ